MSILKGISSAGAAVSKWLTSGIKQGLSGNSILRALQAEGLGYRRTTFLSDLRILQSAETSWSTLRYVRRDATPSISHYLETKSPLTTNFQTVMQVKGYDVETGESVTRDITIGRDTLVTREQLEEDALDTMEETSPKIIVESVMPVMGRQCPLRWEF